MRRKPRDKGHEAKSLEELVSEVGMQGKAEGKTEEETEEIKEAEKIEETE